MKTRIKFLGLLAIMLLSLASLSSFAQQKIEIARFDVNGLDVADMKYTKAQIVAALGEPVKYESYENNYDFYEFYYYNKSRFEFKNGELVEILVEDPQFKCFDGRVKIGSPLSVVEDLPGCRFVQLDHNVLKMVTYSELWVGYSERAVNIGHKNGIIVHVGYSDPT